MIGFNAQEDNQNQFDANEKTDQEILRRHGKRRVLEAVRDYLGEGESKIVGDQEQWLTGRLKRIKDRYFKPL